MTEIKVTEKRKDGIDIIEMKEKNLTVKVTNLGCHILSVLMKDKNGSTDDVVLGLENIDDYKRDDKYIGGILGRAANRIKDGTFTLNGQEYHLEVNNGPNHLHGGREGFDKKIWDYEIKENRVVFSYLSKDMEEGYPGSLRIHVSYELTGDTLTMIFYGTTDKDTIVNLANHTYFNLSGGKEKIYGHMLKIKASQIACIDKDGCPTGERLKVDDTPFDFRKFHTIGERINENHEQLRFAGGYDHPYIFSDQTEQMTLLHEGTGRKVTVSTNLPAVQLYTSNFLEGGLPGKGGKAYENRDGICLETQFLPNSINLEEQPDMILRKEDRYAVFTAYKFEVQEDDK
ncbi:aldose epimerase family protein [Anaerostipes sp.]|uniref:aldose epimerase family protein n=1 Tax=Anaerostipes sp. TaxID=1872530 RepID=UPI0025C0A56D|nr:aldose epimerase family protein [Anaerostipes sp.]MBS7007639.1 galactose mutarotase [Anaerostipes sp.]